MRKEKLGLGGRFADELAPVGADGRPDDDRDDPHEDDEPDRPDDLAHGIAVLAGEKAGEGCKGRACEHYVIYDERRTGLLRHRRTPGETESVYTSARNVTKEASHGQRHDRPSDG